jgi:hypothetical protein
MLTSSKVLPPVLKFVEEYPPTSRLSASYFKLTITKEAMKQQLVTV